MGYGGESEGQGKGGRRGHSSGSVARVRLRLREIGRWVREAGLDTQAGWELRDPGMMSEGSRVVVRGEGPADTKVEGRDQVRLRVIGRWK